MCGILVRVYAQAITEEQRAQFESDLDSLKRRGPDETSIVQCSPRCLVGFTRLAINGVNDEGAQQPFVNKGVVCVVNGEIYNNRLLKIRERLPVRGGGDCIVVPHLYCKGVVSPSLEPRDPRLSSKLDGVYAAVAFDVVKRTLWATRDPFGVRPLFVAVDAESLTFSSLVAGCPRGSRVVHFPPGSSMPPVPEQELVDEWIGPQTIPDVFRRHTRFKWIDAPPSPTGTSVIGCSMYEAADILHGLLERAVRKRRMTEQPLASLLSGGIDSSSVCDLLVRTGGGNEGQALKTFCIGFRGSPDVQHAERVALEIGSDHTTIEATPQDFIAAIRETIGALETFCVTTVRAGVPNFLVGKYIRDHHPRIKVVFNGDGSDEHSAGYAYSAHAPTPAACHMDRRDRMKQIHHFDGLRSERAMAANGLEARTPFLDPSVVKFMLEVVPRAYVYWGPEALSKGRHEKKLLRLAMLRNGTRLSSTTLSRTKEAFSNGVSVNQTGKTWREHIQAHVGGGGGLKAEQQLYKDIYDELFGPHTATHWRGQWTPTWLPTGERAHEGSVDPSARLLNKQ